MTSRPDPAGWLMLGVTVTGGIMLLIAAALLPLIVAGLLEH